MKMRAAFVGLAVGIAMTSSAWGESGIRDSASLRAEPPAPLRGVVREEDVSLLFDYLRLVLVSAIAGKEALPPEELERRAEALANELQRRGASAGIRMLSLIEQRVKEALREAVPQPGPELPPVTPFMSVRSLR